MRQVPSSCGLHRAQLDCHMQIKSGTFATVGFEFADEGNRTFGASNGA